MKIAELLRVGSFAVTLLSATASFAEVVTSPGLFTNSSPINAFYPVPAYDTWFANNVRNGGSVGITDAYPRNDNGSIQFGGPGGQSYKADFEYFFSSPFLLSAVSDLSYDWYRSSASSLGGALHPSLRLLVSDGAGGHSGYLVYEGVYNNVPTAPVDEWTSVDVTSKNVWSTGTLPDAFNSYDRTISDWATLLPNLEVTALSTGIGSGWDGSFGGAVDNISYATTTGRTANFNFEVAATAVPEPASLALLGVSLLGLGIIRRQKRV